MVNGEGGIDVLATVEMTRKPLAIASRVVL